MIMRRKIILTAAASLACLVTGCSQPHAGTTPSPECKYPAEWVGHKVDLDVIKADGRTARIMHPGDPATMDYSPDRLNIIIDDKDIVTQITCG